MQFIVTVNCVTIFYELFLVSVQFIFFFFWEDVSHAIQPTCRKQEMTNISPGHIKYLLDFFLKYCSCS